MNSEEEASPAVCRGVCNQDAVDAGDVIILAIPFTHLASTLGSLHGFENKIVVSPVNPMEKKDFFTFVPPPEGSAALMVKKILPASARICTAFNTIAANRWKALDEELDVAVPVCSDDAWGKVGGDGDWYGPPRIFRHLTPARSVSRQWSNP